MSKLNKILRIKYGVEVTTDNYINGENFVENYLGGIDVKFSKYENVIRNKIVYITHEACIQMCKDFKNDTLLLEAEILFKCDKCNERFSSKQILTRHLNKKNSCDPVKLSCKICNTEYSTKKNLTEHLLTQKHIINTQTYNSTISNNEQHINNSDNANNNNAKTVSNSGAIKHNTVSRDTITTNNNTNIILVNYDNIDILKELNSKEGIEILNKDPKHIIEHIVKVINYNKDKPHLHNTICDNESKNKASCYKDGDWETKNLKLLAEEILDSRGKDLKKLYKKYKVHLEDDQKDAILEFFDQNTYKNDESEEDETTSDKKRRIESNNIHNRTYQKKRKSDIVKLTKIMSDGTRNLKLKSANNKY